MDIKYANKITSVKNKQTLKREKKYVKIVTITES